MPWRGRHADGGMRCAWLATDFADLWRLACDQPTGLPKSRCNDTTAAFTAPCQACQAPPAARAPLCPLPHSPAHECTKLAGNGTQTFVDIGANLTKHKAQCAISAPWPCAALRRTCSLTVHGSHCRSMSKHWSCNMHALHAEQSMFAQSITAHLRILLLVDLQAGNMTRCAKWSCWKCTRQGRPAMPAQAH